MFLTAKAGSLQKCKNAHINRGGEIEKRLAFSTYAALPAGTYGLQAAAGSLYVFGSTAQPSNFPANLNYLRLQLPSLLSTTATLTGIVYSETFNGKVYVVGRFSNGTTHHFYNPVPTNVAVSTINITASNTTATITSVKVGGIELLNATVAANANPSSLGAFMCASINAKSSITGFSAQNSGTTNTIIAPYGSGSYYTGQTVTITAGTGITCTVSGPMAGGPRVAAWDSIASTVGDNSAVAASFASQIENEGPFTAYATDNVITVQSVTENQPFTVATTANNGGSNSNQTLVASTMQAASAEVLATGKFTITTAATTGGVSDVIVNGVSILPSVISGYATVADLATAVAASITAAANNYTATSAAGVVTIKAGAGTGSSANGYTVSATTSGTGVAVGSFVAFSGGADAKAQITNITVGGTFEANDSFSITLTVSALSYTNTFILSSSSSGVGTSLRTFNNKMYSTTRSLLYFSELGDPTKFGGSSTSGAGFINISNQDSGFEDLQGTGVYQGKLAVLSRRSVQIWTVDPDPTKNVASQTLKNIGTFAPRSITNFGDIDVFFLSDSGVRSLRARDASNFATVSDVGTNIDSLIAADLVSLPETTRAAAYGIIEPKDGRYWLALGSKIYVYSYFPTPGISAWSTYEPGFTVEQFAYANSRLYARSGNTIYLYGGISGTEYDDCEVEVVLPYLDAGKPAHTKTLQAVDVTCEGQWDIYVGCDTTAPEARDKIGSIDKPTFDLARIQAAGMGTHIGTRLVTSPGYSGPAKIGNFAAHFEINDAG